MRYSKNIPVRETFELVVCGGGMTGFAAAVSAARRGLKTALLERTGCLGGVATSGGVNHLLGGKAYDSELEKNISNVGGLFDELTELLSSRGEAIDPDTVDRRKNRNPHGWYTGNLASGVPFNAEGMKHVLDELAVDAGVEIFFFTEFIDVQKEDGRINHIICHSKSGLFALECGCVVDTSGDADVAHRSGCPTVLGRKEDQGMAPASLELHVDRVNKEELARYIRENDSPRFRELIKKLREKGEWTFPYDIFISVQLTEPDIFMLNTIRQVGVDGTDVRSLTEGMIAGRRENRELFSVLRRHFPGFSEARIRSTAEVIGIRETRRIIGKGVLKVEDLVEGREFKDVITYSSYGWDLPDPEKPSHQPMSGRQIKGRYVPIPYSSLLPTGVDNLIVAGRCISVERPVLGPIRVMGPCMGMGQAAGLASVLAKRDKLDYAEIDIPELRGMLKEDRCLPLEQENTGGV